MFLALAPIALAVAAFSTVAFALHRRDRAARIAALRAEWGCAAVRVRDMATIGAFYRGCGDREAVGSIDDRTWDDLNMNDVFSVLDRTESVVGQQVLYSRLRATPFTAHLDAFEALVMRMSEDATARQRAQLALGRLRGPAGYDLWWLAQPDSLESAPWHILFPVAAISMAAVAAAVPIWPPAVFLLLAGAIGSLIVRASVARPLRVVTGAFRQLNPLISAADTLSSLDSDPATGPLIGTLRADARRLARLRAIASWAGRDPTAAIGGDMVGLLFEYLNMVFWLDANALYFGSRQLRARRSELLRVLSAVREVDAAIGVASYRADSTGWTRPILRTGTAVLTEVRHPLLPDAVPNTIRLAPPHGVTITGSNMSGKSTFLRTVGVSAILAQTINTCLARRYEAPVFAVRSCIGRADDPAAGKSYYLVEVESVLAMVHAARSTVPHLLLFDELFRGTNAVERIAAGEAVLLGLLAPGPAGGPSPHVVLAATHDQELVGLLDGIYAPHHFADTVDAAGLVFDYKLQPGAATTRNAILLLAQRGAPPELVAHALARAQDLDRTRPTTFGELKAPTVMP